jgi:phospholipase C
MENHTWGQVLGQPAQAPYETGLAHQCGTATNYHSVGSPSLPNYIGATSGSTQGIGDDASPASHQLTVDNLFRQVRTAGKPERSYEEGMTSSCQLNSSSRYAVKHNPAAYYVGGSDRAACQADDVALTTFPTDLAAGHLPAFSFVTPDLCHDTHDCSVQTGDQWLAGWLPPLLNSPEYRSGTTAVILMWDEETPMPNIMVAPSVSPATVASPRFDHFSLLATTEQLLGLPTLTPAPSMRAAFRL